MHPHIKPLTAAILILALLSAGCTDMGGGLVERSTPDITPTVEPTQEHTQMETPIEQQHLYDINPDKFSHIVLEANENLLGIKIEGSTIERDFSGWETIFDDDKNTIFQRESYTSANFDPYFGYTMPNEIADKLVGQYGYPEAVVMEQVDTDGDGALDKVAVRYEGSKEGNESVLEFETEYKNKYWGLSAYLIDHLR